MLMFTKCPIKTKKKKQIHREYKNNPESFFKLKSFGQEKAKISSGTQDDSRRAPNLENKRNGGE